MRKKEQKAQWVVTRILPPKGGFWDEEEPLEAHEVIDQLLGRFNDLLTDSGYGFKFASQPLDVTEHEGHAAASFHFVLDGEQE